MQLLGHRDKKRIIAEPAEDSLGQPRKVPLCCLFRFELEQPTSSNSFGLRDHDGVLACI